MQNEKEIKYFSMFTGVGGFELGIERANSSQSLSKIEQDREGGNGITNQQRALLCTGSIPTLFTSIGCSEIDKYSSELLAKKFPNTKNYGDATKIIPEELPDFDLLVGGFPCQAFSIAGRRKGFEDTRGTLFFDIVRILKVKRPKHILLENVKGLLSHDRGRTFGTIISTLSKLGYVVQWMVLNSEFFGVPQHRERVFIIGSIRGEPIPEILPFRESNKPNIKKDENSKMIHKIYTEFGEEIRESNISPTIRTPGGGGHLPMIMDLYNQKEHSNRSPALTEPHHNNLRIREGFTIRKVTPLECERLQGFPEGWTQGFSNNQRYKMMGNAVTVNVVEAIIREIFLKEAKA